MGIIGKSLYFLLIQQGWPTAFHVSNGTQVGTGGELKNRVFLFKISPCALSFARKLSGRKEAEREGREEHRGGNELNFLFRHMLLTTLLGRQSLIL